MKRTKKFSYQGTSVEAEIVGETNWWAAHDRSHEVDDSILRDDAGRYYLHRDFNPGERVHAISLTAAIIWATRNAPNSDSRRLYIDASNLLTEDRGVDDPPPLPYMSREAWQGSDEYKARFAKTTGAVAKLETPAEPTSINYQGQPLQATLVNQIHGHLPITHHRADWWMAHQGEEELWRDGQGRYYLRRTLQIWDEDSETERPASGRTHVHRLSLKAAVLWAIMRMDARTGDLRRDVQALASPTVLQPTRRFSDGSMVVSLHLKPEVASLVRAVSEMDEDTPLGVVWEATGNHLVGALARGMERERELNALLNANMPEEHQPTKSAVLRLLAPDGSTYAEAEVRRDLLGRLQQRAEACREDWQYTLTNLLEDGLRMANEWMTIHELDDVAVTLLRRYHRQEYGEVLYEKVMPGDVVNGLVVNWLEAMMQIREGRTDGDAIEEARSRRRHGLSDEDEEVIEQVEQANGAGGFTLRMLKPDGSLYTELDVDEEMAAQLRGAADVRGLSLERAVPTLMREYFARRNEESATNGVQLFEDGSMVVTVRFKPEPARLLRAACEKQDCSAEFYLYEGARYVACSDLSTSAENEREFERIFLENAPEVGEAPAVNRERHPAREPEAAVLHGLNASAPAPISAENLTAAQASRQGQPEGMRDGLLHLAADWRAEGERTGGRIANVLTRCADALEAAVAGKEGR